MKNLDKAQVIELETNSKNAIVNDPWKLDFHLMPPSGWLNDPNGLCESNGENHIFFQYTPHDTKSTTQNCWGHYQTPDFVHYTYHLPPLYPDTEYEKNGVYSGSAINTSEGIKAYYTGNVKHPGDHDYINTGREQNLILAENYNSKTGEFESKTVLMQNEDYPSDMTLHVRDPKVFYKDGKYHMLLGARDKNDIGSILIYESKDGRDWEFVETVRGNKELGFMWECPDFVTVDDKDFFIMSPQGIEAEGNKYNNVYQAGFLPVENFGKNSEYGEFYELDHGFDFYAPQTYKDENGRSILIGWMGLPDTEYTYPTTKNNWIHALTVPRVLSQKNNFLYQNPIPELKDLRGEKSTYKLDGTKETIETPKVYELILKNPSQKGELIINDGCLINWNNGLFELNFIDTKLSKGAGSGRDIRRTEIGRLEKLQMFVDASSIEIFINNGQYVFTTRYFPEIFEKLEVEAKGDLKIYALNPFDIKRTDGTDLF